MFLVLSGMAGANMFILSIFTSLFNFTFIAVPMFILMGEILFHSGLGNKALNALEQLLGKVPGRLSIVATVAGVVFGAVSGSAMANTALLGSTLAPEMKKRGYDKKMIYGPIMGVSGLAVLIPPSGLAVLYASIANISVGELLIAGVVPGLVMGTLYLVQIVIRVYLNPSWAPAYEVDKVSLEKKLASILINIFPLSILFFAVVGTIIMGVATPSESAAMGAFGAVILSFLHQKLNFNLLKTALFNTFTSSVMIFSIICGTVGFGQILAYAGIISKISTFATSLDVHPIIILFLMQVVVFILGCFMSSIPIMMITIPIFFPVILQLGFDPIWFAVINIVVIETGSITPPFGMILFLMKGIAYKDDVTMTDLYKGVVPFIACNIATVILIILLPGIATWLPSTIQ